MRQDVTSIESYVFPGVFAPVLSLESMPEAGAEIVDPEPLPDEHLERQEVRLAVSSFVKSLPPRDQEIVRQLFWDGRSQAEVAANLNVSKMAVSKAMTRIVKRGRTALAAYEPPAETKLSTDYSPRDLAA